MEAAVGRTVGVPAQVTEQGRPGALVQRRDDRGVVDLPGLLGDLLDELAGRVRLGAAVVDRVGVPPYALMYAAVKSALPVAVEPGNQSPADMMPSTLVAPTLSGNSSGELAPLDMNMNLGLNFSWTKPSPGRRRPRSGFR